ncbi:MAG: YetF domain-containing protein [Gemmatimonadota bacterium]
MDAITRAVIVYLLLLLIFRIAGKRTLAQITTFDLVLTLIISEAVQQAMVDADNSMTNAFLLVIGLVGFDILISLVKERSPWLDRLIEGTPLVLIEKGKQHPKYMQRERIAENDILHAARARFGTRTLEEIRYAVLEQDGEITIVLKKKDEPDPENSSY